MEESIRRLKFKYDLGIISDAWPSLMSVYANKKMLSHFKPFIISSMYGCTKAGFDLFRFALANVAEHAEECLFVDDSYGNCKRARKLGMQVLILNRSRHFKTRGTFLREKHGRIGNNARNQDLYVSAGDTQANMRNPGRKTLLRDLWTFETTEKLDAFIAVMKNNDIPYEVLSKDKRIVADNGLLVSVEETDYEKARKLLKLFRKNSTNRNR